MFVTQASAAGATAPALKPGQVANPYSPAYNHPYRHGVMPTRQVHALMKQWEIAHTGAHTLATSEQTLSKGASVAGVGVLKGQSKVYLVFYGTQWGTVSTDANGNLKFTNDTAGAAGAAQQMFKGIGTNGELWSAELTQWCDDAATGATSCAASDTTHIPYQQNIFAGAWYDNSAASPSAATAAQLAAEANKAAAHFGNTTTAANRFAYYVILSPKGTNPDNYQGQYCAWHDYTAGSNGNMAYSNQPYNIDSGAGCGVGFVNSPGTLDGFTMTLGHEWHEMMSDQFPSGGWSNHGSGTHAGQENSDECAWIAAGSTGGAANVSFATGTFAEQASWSNDTNNCAITHAIIPNGGGGNASPVANFSFTTSGDTATFTDSSTDSDGTIASHAWTFGDGGTSTATSPSHTYAADGTYSVTETVTDNLGATGSKTSSVTVSTGGGGGNVLSNGVAVTGLAATTGNKLNYTMAIPTGASGLSFVQSGGTGDSDMYVKFGAAPTLSSYDCRPYVNGNAETCSFATPSVGTYYVMLNAYSSFTGVSLKGSYSTGGGGGTALTSGVPVALPSKATGGVSPNYTLAVPAGKTSVVFKISGGTGDADLYVKLGTAPTSSSYDCRPYLTGNSETCTFNSPTAGTYYVNVRAYAAYSGVSLVGTISP